ncbi:MAG TPA: methyltransferase domain-containing protein [Anaerolineales bacterium]|nr:methyltransferase domain-containing protein [Anaerolineales bacterium]
MSSVQPTDTIAVQRDAFVERFLGFASGTFSLFSIYIGDRLGLYRALAEGGPATSAELAAQTRTHERYIREWLEQQTVAGILEVEDEHYGIHSRRFSLPLAHAEPLIDCSSLNYMVPLAQLLVGAVRPLPAVLDAYRNGGGVPFDEYGADLREGQAAINYPAFWHQLPNEWLPAIPDIHARLQADPPARVADIGCGYGWSSLGMARGYPRIHVDGFDLDAPSIERALQNAGRNRLTDRVHFEVRDASDPALAGQYDLVTVFEALHDMNHPVGALGTMRRLVREGGTVLIVDERVGDTFTPTGNDVEGMMYGWSILHCLPVGMTDENAAGTGTVMRADTLRNYAAQAGFSQVDILPIEHFFFRFYRLTP